MERKDLCQNNRSSICPLCMENCSHNKDSENFKEELFMWLNEHLDLVREYISQYVPKDILDKTFTQVPRRNKCDPPTSPSPHGVFSSNTPCPTSYSVRSTRLKSRMRKISSHEFEPVAFRPILSLAKDGSQSFLSAYEVGRRRVGSGPTDRTSPSKSLVEFFSSFRSVDCRAADKAPGIFNNIADLHDSDLLQDLVLDIWNDSDLTSLCFKILRNVCVLLNADRSSLFMVDVDSSTGDRCLSSKLFDVTARSTFEDSFLQSQSRKILLPFGVGIVGWVAKTGEYANISNVYADPRFSDQVDQLTGFHTRCILCMPIKNGEGEVLAVAQVVNKLPPSSCGTISSNESSVPTNVKVSSGSTGSSAEGREDEEAEERGKKGLADYPVFTDRDVSVFKAYTAFCGIGLHHAQILWKSQLETKRSQVLLELARIIFTEQSDVSRLIYRILTHCQSLLSCQRCQILLAHNVKHNAVFNRVYDFTWQDASRDPEELVKGKHRVEDARFSINLGITRHVAETGETINLPDARADSRFDASSDPEDPAWRTQSILCMPIKHSDGRVLGVCQLVNKSSRYNTADLPFPAVGSTDANVVVASTEIEGSSVDQTWTGTFSRSDESLFEAFALFAGLGIANTQMYEQVLRAEAKQRIAFDVLSYHATATQTEAAALAKELIPSARYFRLCSFSFTDFHLSVDDTVKACLRMFTDLDLVNRFHIDYNSLCRWLLSVKKNYRDVTYHNWRHAFNVAQTMFAMLKTGGLQTLFGDLECLAIIIACLSHDLDHRGTNNQFQIKTMSPLVNLYSTSVLEHHHFDQCIMLLNTKGNEILGNLGHDEYRRAVHLMEHAILATDLSRYFRRLPEFRQLLQQLEVNGSLPSPAPGETVGPGKDAEAAVLCPTVWEEEIPKRELLTSMLMTACDVSASTKPWPVQKKTAELVASEFFEQGDLEKQQLNIKPEAIMDRDFSHQFPQMQIEFIETICAPVYQVIVRVCGKLKPLLDGCMANRDCWEKIAKGEPIDESLMRLPDDSDGGPPFRDRMIQLLSSSSATAAVTSRGGQQPKMSSKTPPSKTLEITGTASTASASPVGTTVGGRAPSADSEAPPQPAATAALQ